MFLLFIYIAIALGISFLCSVMEAVLLSIPPSFIAQMKGEKPKFGEKLRSLKDEIDRPLAAILSLNTIAHTVGAAGAGAQAAIVFGDAYVGIISGILTLLILVVSEIIPKTLGVVYWRQLTKSIVFILTPVMFLMWPLVKLAEGLTSLLTHGKKRVLIHREEFIALAEMGAKEGVFHADESRILKNLFRFNRVYASDIMTPGTVVQAFPETQTVAETIAREAEFRFSRIPIFGKDSNDVTGFVLKSDILLQATRQQGDTPLSDMKRPLLFVPKKMPLRNLFEHLINERAHIALVVDEYGGMAGIVTMEDIIETLLGLEIVDEADAVQDMQELARKQWTKRARQLGIISDTTDLER